MSGPRHPKAGGDEAMIQLFNMIVFSGQVVPRTADSEPKAPLLRPRSVWALFVVSAAMGPFSHVSFVVRRSRSKEPNQHVNLLVTSGQ